MCLQQRARSARRGALGVRGVKGGGGAQGRGTGGHQPGEPGEGGVGDGDGLGMQALLRAEHRGGADGAAQLVGHIGQHDRPAGGQRAQARQVGLRERSEPPHARRDRIGDHRPMRVLQVGEAGFPRGCLHPRAHALEAHPQQGADIGRAIGDQGRIRR